jgi:MraZ protein
MLRGNCPARIDDKGRLKVPEAFKKVLEERYSSPDFWVTSLEGNFARIYPLEEWVKVEEKLSRGGTFNSSRGKLLNRLNYYGQVVSWDKQGRILIPSILREKAEIKGDVAVLGQLDWLAVWNNDKFLAEVINNPMTDEDGKVLDELGI